MMRIIIAGSRDATEEQVRHALDACPWIGFASAIVSGTAKGADEFGERWAEEQGIEVLRFPADWKKHGKRAGPVRNREMAENAEGLVAVWDGESRGTLHMIEFALARGLRVFVFRTDTNEVIDHRPRGEIGDLWDDAEERAASREFGGGMSRLSAERAAGREARR